MRRNSISAAGPHLVVNIYGIATSLVAHGSHIHVAIEDVAAARAHPIKDWRRPHILTQNVIASYFHDHVFGRPSDSALIPAEHLLVPESSGDQSQLSK